MGSNNSFGTRAPLNAGGQTFEIFSLRALEMSGFPSLGRLPFSLKILLENLLRREDARFVDPEDIQALAGWDVTSKVQKEIAFTPARVLLQDFTGVPAVVDLAAMRDGILRLGGDPKKVNPLQPVELVIDHSVQVDHYTEANAADLNARLEFTRNRERYTFLRWGQDAFQNFRVVPPDTGIVHQVNLEYLARVVFKEQIDGRMLAYPDTLVGTDSHTTMVNGLGVVGWGVGGIEAEAAMLGQPISMLIPEVIGFRLVDRLPEGATATDLVLTITEKLRKLGVVGKFVEFFGPGLEFLTIADRATLGNMSPEYGATIAICPIDDMTLDYLRLTGRDDSDIRLVEAYAKEQGLFRTDDSADPIYTSTVELDLSTVEPSLAGPKRPQDRVSLRQARVKFEQALEVMLTERKPKAAPAGAAATASAAPTAAAVAAPAAVPPGLEGLSHGSVVVAAITSCTNTSNPSVMIGAGLLARNAVKRGLKTKAWVKTSLAPGSLIVTEYYKAAGLLEYLAELGFNIVGYGCTTCIGNSGPLPDAVSKIVKDQNLVVASVLSGNRNFEGRIQSQVRANYLASPPLVVAYALAGKMQIDLTSEPLGLDPQGQPVYLKDIWPPEREIQETMLRAVRSEMFRDKYAHVFDGDDRWRSLPVPTGERFDWSDDSTYIRNPPFFEHLTHEPAPPSDIRGARVLAVLGDSVTTDHISPAGSIPADSPAGKYLIGKGVTPADFNSYGARRGNHEVMMRGTFANIRLRNQLAPGTEGGWTMLLPQDEVMTIYDASMQYQAAGVPLLVIAGKEYRSGSSRDWAAKGTLLLGVKAVIAESFERIHRSNLVNMGVLPMCFRAGENAATLKLTGRETYEVLGMGDTLRPSGDMTVRVTGEDGTSREIAAVARIDTPEELVAFRHGGILPYVFGSLRRGNTLPSSSEIKRQATAIGFDLCGIAPVGSFPELAFLREWLELGYAGEMQYLHRSADRRGDVRTVLPSARSVIVLATIYNVERPYSNEDGDPDRAAIARYAWGDDYHVVIEERLETLLAWLRAHAGRDFEGRAYVDTGPVQERVYAQYAGIGWIGKNTCVINEELGSWLFLSVVISNLALEPDQPALDQCGTCARCLDACPTGALVEPHVMDATKCLSYLTIELKGAIPEAARDDIGHHVYGCDICQDVCPWNLTPSTGVSAHDAWLPRTGLDAPSLLALWQRSDDELRALLKGSAMKRAGVTRLRRNLAVAVGNSGAPASAALLEAHDAPTCREPLVADHVAWAAAKLRG